MGLLDLCVKYYNSNNLYDILGIDSKANEKDVKKAYHKLSLKVHPDRVKEDEKLEATEKFKVLGSIHSILSDKDKRAAYDETGTIDDDELNSNLDNKDWTTYWRVLFKKITEQDIINYEKEYTDSQEEKTDLKKAYLAGKGDMDYICDHVQFARSEREPRLREILNKMIEDGEIPAYKIFTNESEKKRKKRHAKENFEEKEAEELKRELGLGNENEDLAVMIRSRNEARAEAMDVFIDSLAAKYGKPKPASTKRKASTKDGPAKKKKTRK